MTESNIKGLFWWIGVAIANTGAIINFGIGGGLMMFGISAMIFIQLKDR